MVEVELGRRVRRRPTHGDARGGDRFVPGSEVAHGRLEPGERTIGPDDDQPGEDAVLRADDAHDAGGLAERQEIIRLDPAVDVLGPNSDSGGTLGPRRELARVRVELHVDEPAVGPRPRGSPVGLAGKRRDERVHVAGAHFDGDDVDPGAQEFRSRSGSPPGG